MFSRRHRGSRRKASGDPGRRDAPAGGVSAAPQPETGPAAGEGPAIHAERVVREFGSFRAVDNVSFSVERGSVFGLLGANGAGKSTLIRMLCGILEPTSGEAFVAGKSISAEPDAIKKRIGYMSQLFSLYSDLTVRENIRLFAGIYGIFASAERERAAWALHTAGLEGSERIRAGSLSGGYRQRLALACALLHEPEVLFLDEPTSGVDPLARRSFWDLIASLTDGGMTVLVTTHYLDEAEYCSSLAMMHEGRVIASGTPREIKEQSLRLPTWEITTDRPYELERTLRGEAGVEGVGAFGRRIHIRADEQVAARIRAGNNISIEKIVPTLEDVFIALTEAERREAEDPL